MNRHTHLILENDQVRLIPLQHYHIAELLPIAVQHPDLLQYSPSPFGDLPKLTQYIETALQQRVAGSRYPFVIWSKKHQRLVGSTSYGNITLAHQRLEIGWTWLEEAVQGTELNQQCKFLLLSYAFEHLTLERVEFKIDDRNEASKKAVLKIGAQKEGTLRSHTLMNDHFRRDTTYFSILKKDWSTIKSTIFSGFTSLSIQNKVFSDTLKIEVLADPKQASMDLFLLADSVEKTVQNYLTEAEIWLIKHTNQVLGSIAWRKEGKKGIIDNLVVYEPYRKMGVAQFLLTQVIQKSKETGLKSLYITAASTSLEQLYLYQKLEFSIDKVLKNYFPDQYPAPIFENGLRLKDQLLFKLVL